MTRILAATVAALGLAVAGLVLHAQRLTQDAVPVHYDLHFTPDLLALRFQGDERIEIRLPQPTASITLNAAQIQFVETTVTAGGVTQQATVALNPGDETATITVPRPLPAGAATMAIRYT